VPPTADVTTITEPASEIPVIATPDVLVVGGGPAGIAAATAAAREGADVMLIERYGYLGGLATGGLIILLLTLDDGDGRQIVGGSCQEVVDRLTEMDAVYHPPQGHWGDGDPDLVEHYRRWGLVWGRDPQRVRFAVAFDPEAFKVAADAMVTEAGARIRLHTSFARPIVEAGRINTVLVESKSGREAIRPRVVVDCTGDGDVFARAGAEFESVSVLPWMWYRMGNVRDIEGAIEVAAGSYFEALGGRFFHTLGRGRTLMPWGSADSLGRRIDPLDADELSAAEIELRGHVYAQSQRIRLEVPGFEDAYLHDIATQLGITESRRLSGRYQLVGDDMGKSFPDTVARTGHWTRLGVVYDIPYRCLTYDGVENLIVAGRCISVARQVHQATKEIPASMATGEAAGVAAAVAASAALPVHEVDIDDVRARLQEHGALI
jgi:hypothetical protein